MSELCEWGYDSERGQAALARMNWAHGHYRISNDDFLYVLSTFIFEPIRWIDAVGWRETCRNEQLAYYCFWREVGTRIGIREIPASYEAFEAWARAYERAQFRFAETNRGIGSATRDLFAAWFPRIFTPVVRYSIYAMLDDAMIAAFGFPRPRPFTRTLLRAGLRLRGSVVRWVPPRRTPHFLRTRATAPIRTVVKWRASDRTSCLRRSNAAKKCPTAEPQGTHGQVRCSSGS